MLVGSLRSHARRHLRGSGGRRTRWAWMAFRAAPSERTIGCRNEPRWLRRGTGRSPRVAEAMIRKPTGSICKVASTSCASPRAMWRAGVSSTGRPSTAIGQLTGRCRGLTIRRPGAARRRRHGAGGCGANCVGTRAGTARRAHRAGLGACGLHWDWGARRPSSTGLARSRRVTATRVRASASLVMQVGRLEEAIALARRAVALDPLSKPAHVVLGDCCMRAGRLDSAVAPSLSSRSTLRRMRESRTTSCRAPACCGAVGRGARRGRARTMHLLCVALAQHTRGDAAASDAALRRLIDKYRDTACHFRSLPRTHGAGKSTRPWLDRLSASAIPGLGESVALCALHGDSRWLALMRKMGIMTPSGRPPPHLALPFQ